MRWDEQRVEEEGARRLAGFPEAVVRTFDAPQAMDVNFHEVQAKSALNHVPGAPWGFEWTVNVYRGCTHACRFCVWGGTPILMAEGHTKPIAELRMGETIIGTERRGNYRRYVITKVRDHWETRKEAYRITLEDGTELVASGDHRFLTNRGWKFVVGTEWGGRLQRPHLTTNNKADWNRRVHVAADQDR